MLFKGEHSSLEKSFKLKKKKKRKENNLCAESSCYDLLIMDIVLPYIHLVCGIVVNQQQQL